MGLEIKDLKDKEVNYIKEGIQLAEVEAELKSTQALF